MLFFGKCGLGRPFLLKICSESAFVFKLWIASPPRSLNGISGTQYFNPYLHGTCPFFNSMYIYIYTVHIFRKIFWREIIKHTAEELTNEPAFFGVIQQKKSTLSDHKWSMLGRNTLKFPPSWGANCRVLSFLEADNCCTCMAALNNHGCS